jgi:hypothetical protein
MDFDFDLDLHSNNEDLILYPGKFIKQEEINIKGTELMENEIKEKQLKEIYISKKYKTKKVIVFDLDETIGSFGDFYKLWEIIYNFTLKSIEINNSNFLDKLFDDLLDLYPEFLRHGILNILEFIHFKKLQKLCKIYLYTNNQILLNSTEKSPTDWVLKIANYLSKKISPNSEQLFDQIICAFKINNKKIEINRTTFSKTHNDFIKCTLLPKKTEICFIDDKYYSGMKNERIYYIQPRQYIHYLNSSKIIDRFLSSSIFKNISTSEIQQLLTNEIYNIFGNEYKNIITKSQFERDIRISQKMMFYIREFFYLTTKKIKTRRNRTNSFKNITKRKI